MTADPILAHLEAVVALGERMAHDARGLIAARKQATAGIVGGDPTVYTATTDDVPTLAEVMAYAFTPDPTPPLPGAVRVADTERDGEMVPTWLVRGDDDMGDDERDRWEWQAIDREEDIDWMDLGLKPTRTYLVRRKAEVQ